MCSGVRALRGLPPRFLQQSEPVRLKFATHNTDLRSGTDVWRGIWNWVRNALWAATTESLGMNASTAIAQLSTMPFQWLPTGGGQSGDSWVKNVPLHFFYTTATALSFTSFSLHTYENLEVVLPHPVLFNCEWLHWITEQFSYFEKIVARYTHLLLSAQGYWSMETDRIG